ncbi:hypothetical protein [Saliphagus sp. LR7]|uniref:hypothetical protein n=1 Tax=Saliphagus sp. LR7 TaxID=2282654 RepID=UPI000DF805EF|nr:hypothetical protein [Saliphagus sp. LR7]
MHKELVYQDSFSGEFSFTFSYERDDNVSYEIRILGLSCSDGDEVVDLQFDSFSAGDYSFVTKDATDGQTDYDNQDQFRLLSNEIGGNNGMTGVFSITEGRGRPLITPIRAADYQGSFEYLFRPQSENTNPRPDLAMISGKVSNATITIQRIVDMP